jgi:fibronectin type 3 domain-containing protein
MPSVTRRSWFDLSRIASRRLLLATCASLALSSHAAHAAGLVAAYAFDEGTGTAVTDASGNGNNGVATSTTWTTSGKFGNALVFNGASALVSIADSASLRLTTGMTLEAWVFPTTVNSAWRDIIYKGDDNYYLEGTSDNSSRPAGGGTFKATPVYGTAALTANAWSHVAITYDKVNVILYVNGTQVATGAATANIATSANPLQIGGDGIYGQYFNGRIDEVRIYNRALTATEIQTDMNTAVGGGAPPVDTQPPTAPAGLSATVVSGTQLNLAWTASTDNVGVTGYQLERCQGAGCSNFAQIATPTATNFSDTGLTAGASYSYRVRATDAALNLSGYSNTASATTTAPDTQAPTAPANLTANASSGTQINLGWSAATDNVGVTGYLLERCQGAGCSTFTQIATPTGLTFSDTGLTAGTSYTYQIRARDAANNLGPYSNLATAITLSPDTQPPTAPANLVATTTSSSTVNLTWTASTDNVGVTGYRVERCQGAGCSNFGQIAAPTGNSFGDSGLAASTTYLYRVRAADAANNLSGYSNTATALTDATPPSTGLVAAYSFDEGTGTSVADSSGKGNVGTTANTTWSASGKFGSALVFNGTSARVTINNSTSLQLTTAMTLEAWVNPAVANGSWSDVIYKGDDNYYLEGTSTNGGRPGGGGTFVSSPIYGTAALPANTWSHLAMTYDKTTLRFYVNGVQASSVAATANLATSTNPVQIGGDSLYGQFFNGRIDEVRVYSRALTQAEIQTDMNTAVGGAPPADTTPPTAPASLVATPFNSSRIDLSWTASTDNVGVTGYMVESCQGAGCTNFAPLVTVTSTTYSNTGLAGSTSYSYRVRATDAAANLSAYSNTSTASTPAAPDTTPPTAPTNLVASATSSSAINLSWTASTDNVAVTGYRVERCQGAGCTNFAQIATPTTTSFGDSGLSASTSYGYRVRAADAASNLSGYSNTASATTPAPSPAAVHVQSNYAAPATAQTTVAVALSAAQGAGNLNLVFVGWTGAAQVQNVTDSRGNGYQLAAGPTASGTVSQAVFYAANILAGANTVTVTFDSAATQADVRVAEYTGVDSINPIDTGVEGSGNSATSNSGNVTTTNALDTLVAGNYTSTGTSGPGAQYTQRLLTAPNGNILEDRAVTAVGSYNATAPLNASGLWVMQMIALRVASGPPPDTTPPSTPSNVQATAASTSQINVTWNASTDNVGVTGYRVERCQGAGCTNFVQVAAPTTTSLNDSGLNSNTTYLYRVRAADGVGNLSTYSTVVSATTLAVPTGLVAAYSFDEGTGTTASDSSGNVNTGVIANATWTTSGKYGNALSFNGSTGRVTVTDAPSLRLTTGMTLEAWVYPASNTSAWRDVIYKGDDNYYLEGTSDQSGRAAGGGTFRSTPVFAPSALALNTWSHLALTYDRTTVRLYVNGTEVANGAATANIATSSNPLQIGSDNLYGQFFNGRIDEVRVYNRALSPTEIQTDMNTPVGGVTPPPVDTTPPTVTLTAPAPGATLANTVTFSANPLDTGVGVGGVQFQVDGINVGAAVTASPYTLSFNTAQFANGTHVVSVYAWDKARNVSTITSVTVTFNNASPGNPASTGWWSGLQPWPIVSVHINLMYTGRVLAWDGQEFGYNATVWDPVTSTFTDRPSEDNLFCSGHVNLPDGRIMVVGGHVGAAHVGITDVNMFNPATETWAAAAPMQYPRWYPTATRLGDGRILVNSGETNCYRCFATVPEIYNPATNTWTQLSTATQSLPYYPHVYQLPDGRVLVPATSENIVPTRVLNLATPAWSVMDSQMLDGGTSAMYLPGKFLKAGASVDPDNPPPSSQRTAYVLDTTQASPAWRATNQMAFPRTFATLTLLPDGSVLMTGGGRTTNGTDVANAVLEAEIWSPTTEAWTTLAPMHAPRLYHSEAVLLPDARVLISGGGRFNTGTASTDQFSGEIFAPPYLFKGARPTITSVPTQLSYGQNFTVTTPDAATIAKVVLIPPADVTHTFNANQRFVPLTFTASSGSLTVTAPANGNLAPPGYYMLFIVGTNGVPSVSKFVKF